MELYHAICQSPIGPILLESNSTSLTGLYLSGERYSAELNLQNNVPPIIKAQSWLDLYFSGKKPDISSLSLLPSGTSFQKDVWEQLCCIPYGKTVTYGYLAKKIAVIRNTPQMSSQAIGQAVGANPISIIIPCHRVIGANGKLTGYASGLENKIWLLQHEANHI